MINDNSITSLVADLRGGGASKGNCPSLTLALQPQFGEKCTTHRNPMTLSLLF